MNGNKIIPKHRKRSAHDRRDEHRTGVLATTLCRDLTISLSLSRRILCAQKLATKQHRSLPSNPQTHKICRSAVYPSPARRGEVIGCVKRPGDQSRARAHVTPSHDSSGASCATLRLSQRLLPSSTTNTIRREYGPSSTRRRRITTDRRW